MYKSWTLVLLAALCCASLSSAQWIAQQSNLPEGVRAGRMSVINENVVWTYGQRDYYANTNDFTRTLDGGEHWTAGKIPNVQLLINLTAIDADTAWAAVAYKSTNAVVKTRDGGKTWQDQWIAPTLINFVYFFNAREGLALCDPIDLTSGYYDYLIYTTSDGGASWQTVPAGKKVVMSYQEGISLSQYSALGNIFYSGTSNGRFIKVTDKGNSWKAFPCWRQGFIWPSFKDSLNGMAAVTTMDTHYAMVITSNGGANWYKASSPDFLAYFPASIPDTPGGWLLSGAVWGLGKNGSAFTVDNGTTWTMIDDAAHGWTTFYNRELGWSGDGASTRIWKWSMTQEPAVGSYPVAGLKYSPLLTGSSSQPQTVSITNYGKDPLVISSINLPSPNFKVGKLFAMPKSLNSLETARFEVSFTPTIGGIIHDSLVVVSNAAKSPAHAIPLEGEGIVISQVQPGTLYGIAGKKLYTIDPVTGTAAETGPLAQGMGMLTVHPVSQELIGATSTATKTDFYRISASTGQIFPLLLNMPIGNVRGIAFKSDTLFGATLSGQFYRFDLVKPSGTKMIGKAAGLKYYTLTRHPISGEFYASITPATGAVKEQIVTINPVNGDTTLIGATGQSAVTRAITFSPSGELYGLGGTIPISLIAIDLNTGAASPVVPTSVGTLAAMTWAPLTTPVTESGDDELIPSAFTLQQNYPNPFNSQTTIEYAASRPERVEIAIFSMLGERVATLQRGLVQAGKHRVVWLGDDAAGRQLPSGLYMLRMSAGGFTASRKMLLIR